MAQLPAAFRIPPAPTRDIPESVRISNDYEVPGTFTTWSLARDRTGNLIADDDNVAVIVQADVVMVDGRHRLANPRFPNVAHEALSPKLLAAIDWDLLGAQLVFDYVNCPGAEVDIGRLTVAANSTRSYNKLTFADHERIVALADEGGPQAVAAAFYVSKRQANRYIAAAREAVKQ